MKTITRIHIARVPYDIETVAEARLQHYLTTIQASLDKDTADEVMQDIELRITELLAERQVKPGGVITADDVRVIETHLGSPDQFSDADEQGKSSRQNDAPQTRRLLRDTDHGIFGGVAAGLGAYLNADVNLVRLMFVLLALISGLGILIYLVLWLLVPAASTSAEKLEMHGHVVTAEALQRYRASMTRTLRWSGTTAGRVIVTFWRTIISICTVSVAVSIAVGLALATSVYCMQPARSLVWPYHTTVFVLGLSWLFGLSLISLLTILTRQVWGRKFTSTMRLTFLSSLALALIAVTGLAGLTPLVADHYKNLYGNGKSTTALAIQTSGKTVPITALDVTSVTSDYNTSTDNLNLSYVVTSGPVHATYQTKPGMHRPDITVAETNGTLVVTAHNLAAAVPNCLIQSFCRGIYLPLSVTVYGPAVQQISDTDGGDILIGSLTGPLAVTASNESNVMITDSTLTQLTATISNASTIDTSSSTAQTAIFHTLDPNSAIYGPATDNLTLDIPSSCTDNNNMSSPNIYLQNYSKNTIINGQTVSQATIENNYDCISLND